MSYVDYLKTIDRGSFDIVKDVEVAPNIKVSIYDKRNYEMPLDRENWLTDIYDKMYLSRPLTYQQKQVMESYDIMRKGDLYSFTPSGFMGSPPKIGSITKMSKKKIGLKKRKK